MPEAVDTDERTYTGNCPDCDFTVITTDKLHVPHVCPHTLNRHTLRVH